MDAPSLLAQSLQQSELLSGFKSIRIKSANSQLCWWCANANLPS